MLAFRKFQNWHSFAQAWEPLFTVPQQATFSGLHGTGKGVLYFSMSNHDMLWHRDNSMMCVQTAR